MSSNPTRDGNDYVRSVLATYLWVPATPQRASRQDRQLANVLEQRRVPLQAVLDALLIGTARRVFRSADRAPLAPVRTLHYFLPVLDEVMQQPPEPGYSEYVRAKLAPLADAKLRR